MESKGFPELRQVLEEMAWGQGGYPAGGLQEYIWEPPCTCPSSAPRQKHVATLLDIRGLRHRPPARGDVLAVTGTWNSAVAALSPPRDRYLLRRHPGARPPVCLSLPLFLGRLTLSRLACLPWPRPPAPSPFWPAPVPTLRLPTPPQCPPSLLLTDHPPPGPDSTPQPGTTDAWAGKILGGLLSYPKLPVPGKRLEGAGLPRP